MSAWMLAGLALSIPFIGKPTYLACTFEESGALPPVAIAISRTHKAVALTTPSTGRVERHQATVSGATISFDSPLPYGNVNYAISRVDLSLVRTTAGPSIVTSMAKGQCRVVETPELSF